MRAWVLEAPGKLVLREMPDPAPGPDEVVVKVECCGICRTDIHVVESEIPLPMLPVIPGHQAVGRIVAWERPHPGLSLGQRVGVAWLHRSCGACAACVRGQENLCANALFTGYHRHGGFAELVRVPAAFAYPLPENLDPPHVAPLLCAGIIGYRALRQAELTTDEAVGLYGFGSSAHIALQVARLRRNRIFVVTRGARHRDLARQMGAEWVGDSDETPPVPLDRAVIFAPAGELIPSALRAVRWGGTVASACLHMSPIPAMDYTSHLFGERTLRSTTANTRADGRELLALAPSLSTRVEIFSFTRLPEGLEAIRRDLVQGSAVLSMH